jgi:hypothetical protein
MNVALRLFLIVAGAGISLLALIAFSTLPGMRDVVDWTLLIVSLSLIVASLLYKQLSKKGSAQ